MDANYLIILFILTNVALFVCVVLKEWRGEHLSSDVNPGEIPEQDESEDVLFNNVLYIRKQNALIEDKEIIDQCTICKLPIYQDEQLLKCPFCQCRSHRDHLLEWLKIKGFCPYCGFFLKILMLPFKKI